MIYLYSEYVVITYGSCLNLTLTYRNSKNELEDISQDSFSILNSSNIDIFQNVEFSIDPGDPNKVYLQLDSDHVRMLTTGAGHWFRVVRHPFEGCEEASQKIELVVI